MRLEPGVRVGTYEIIGVLGAGGMGEVYRARDTRLRREVAIKTLPQEFSRDASRVARFQREAEVLASLNHPNIASIYELEETEESPFLILELVEGETLAEKLTRGPIPLEESLHIALQICEAIETAHERGVIHRDLKPANIKLTPQGVVKLLDFGLARMFEPEPADVSKPMLSPTVMTIHGVILGTAAYMSPEQARGKAIDKRTDIWAFGCVLFEMLSGTQAFGGETVSDTISAILSAGPDMSALPDTTPTTIRDLLRRCMVKDSRSRLHDIADARIEISEAMDAPPESSLVERAPKRRIGTLMALGLLLALAAFFGGGWLENSRKERPVEWSGSLLVGGSTVAWGPRVSPDGKTVAFIVMVDAQTQVALMDAESGSWDVLTKRPEAGVHLHAAWSRDGSKVYFARGSTLGVNVYSIPPVGGEERLVLDNAYFPEPLPDGSLLITRSQGGNQPQLFRFWPEDSRLEPLPVFLGKGLDPLVPIRAFPDGKEAVFFGKPMTAEGIAPLPNLHSIDLASGAIRKLASNLGMNADLWPISVAPNHSALSDSPSGDLHRVVAIDRADGKTSRVLFPLTGRFSGLDMTQDGTVFVDQQNNTLEVLRIDPSGGPVRRIARAETYFLRSHTIEMPDGRVIVPGILSGRPKLILTKTNKLATSLIDTVEETSGPITAVGATNLDFMLGSGPGRSIAIASISDRRVIRRISVPNAASIAQLASSPDANVLYYVSEGVAWEVPVDGGEPRRIADASSIAVHPNGKEIFLQRVGPDLSVRLFRKPLAGGPEVQIKIGDEVRMGDVPLATNAVNKDGKILVTTALDQVTWYWQISIFDPKTGHARHVPTDFAGDILYAGWAADGDILAMGVNTEGSIWRFRPQTR